MTLRYDVYVPKQNQKANKKQKLEIIWKKKKLKNNRNTSTCQVVTFGWRRKRAKKVTSGNINPAEVFTQVSLRVLGSFLFRSCWFNTQAGAITTDRRDGESWETD